MLSVGNADGRRTGTGTLVMTVSVMLIGVAGLTLVLLELSTPRSISGTAIHSLTTAGVVPIVAAVSVLLATWAINTRTGAEIPLWINVAITVIVLIWVLETLSPGAISDTLLAALAAGLEEVSAIIWIAIVAGGGYLLYRRVSGGGDGDGPQETRVTFDFEDGEG